jgi:hypothetical protein
MNIDIIELEENDMVMVHHNIGNLAPEDVDKYCTKILKGLPSVFGKGHVVFFPVREGDTWDFTIVRKPVKKKSIKSYDKRRN